MSTQPINAGHSLVWLACYRNQTDVVKLLLTYTNLNESKEKLFRDINAIFKKHNDATKLFISQYQGLYFYFIFYDLSVFISLTHTTHNTQHTHTHKKKGSSSPTASASPKPATILSSIPSSVSVCLFAFSHLFSRHNYLSLKAKIVNSEAKFPLYSQKNDD